MRSLLQVCAALVVVVVMGMASMNLWRDLRGEREKTAELQTRQAESTVAAQVASIPTPRVDTSTAVPVTQNQPAATAAVVAPPATLTAIRNASVSEQELLKGLLWEGASVMPAPVPGFQGWGDSSHNCSMSLTLGVPSPKSLDDLMAKSKYVVEVTVISAFPVTERVLTSRISTFSTDFVLAPQRVLKGQVAADRFVVDQVGGQVEGRKRCSDQYPGGLMSPGQRYILFLQDPDEFYRHLPQREGLQRFVTTTGFLGVVLVEKDKVEFSSGLRFRDSYDGWSAEQFMAEIATRTQNR